MYACFSSLFYHQQWRWQAMGITHMWCIAREDEFSHKNHSCLDKQENLRAVVVKVLTVTVYVSRLDTESPQANFVNQQRGWRQAVKPVWKPGLRKRNLAPSIPNTKSRNERMKKTRKRTAISFPQSWKYNNRILKSLLEFLSAKILV
jgi:hypothetical protein